jgi:hydroxyacylglutathione hydrolase
MAAAHHTLHRIFLGNVSCYLIYSEKEALLVDCGNSGYEVRIMETFRQLGLDPGMLNLLVLTHVHFDHAGSARKIKELTGCRIVVHRSEAERLRRGTTPIPRGTRWKAKLLVALGRMVRPGIMRFPGAEPDILVDHELDLSPYGFQGRLIHVPGHTPGSMVVLLEGGAGDLLAGDTFFGLEGKLHFPPFAENPAELLESWQRIRSLPAGTIHPAHGKPFSFERFLKEYPDAVERYGQPGAGQSKV